MISNTCKDWPLRMSFGCNPKHTGFRGDGARVFSAVVLAAALSAASVVAWGGQIPPQDIRNTVTPGTNTHFRFDAPATLGAWEQRRVALRRQILTAAGLNPMPERSPLHPQVFGRLDRKAYSIEKVLVDTFPGYWLGGNLYRPVSGGKHPALLLAHGHWTYGRLERQQLSDPPALAAALARAGFVVFMYDMVGYNDTVQTPHRFGSDSEQLWGFGPLGLQLWNSMRALDFVLALPNVDPERVGIAGPSGGGTQTMMLTAVDDRVRFSSPINMVSAYMQGGDFCENAPGLRVGTNNVEIAAMAAPRPMFVISATGDWTRHVPPEEFPEIQKVYELYGKKQLVEVVQIDAPHNMNEATRLAEERYLARVILQTPDADKITEDGIEAEGIQDMLALFGRSEPAGAVTYDQLFGHWKEQAKQQAEHASLGESRERLALTLGVAWPAKVLRDKEHDGRTVLGREGLGDRVPARYEHHGKRAVLLLSPAGADEAWKQAERRGPLGKDVSVLAIDAFNTGAAMAKRNTSEQHFLTFNRSDDANRVQDVLTALRFLDQQHLQSIDIYAEGASAWWAEFAAAVAPRELAINLHIPDQSLVDSEAAYLANFNVPGILRAGGLQTADRVVKERTR